MVRRIILALFAAAALSLSLVSVVSAGKISGSVTLDQPSPHYADIVTFSVKTTAPISLVNLACYQNGTLVVAAGGLAHHEAAYTSEPMGFQSQAYTSGAADCTATLRSYRNGKFTELATAQFTVVP
jgi:hypothetical protein